MYIQISRLFKHRYTYIYKNICIYIYTHILALFLSCQFCDKVPWLMLLTDSGIAVRGSKRHLTDFVVLSRICFYLLF